VKEAGFKYRCRMCGEIFGNISCSPDNDRMHRELVNAIHHVVVNNQSPVPILKVHGCSIDKIGIGDLIGVEVEGDHV